MAYLSWPSPSTHIAMAQLSTVANRDPASLQPDNVDDHDGRESHDADRDSDEAGASQERGTWTPEPEPYDAEKFAAWGRKHYGDDWYEQREKMFEERKFATNPHQDPIYKQRQKALREMEREREKGKLPTKGKPWQEVLAWARMHYGEEWYRHREALDRDRQEVREALDPDERKKKSLKVGRRRNLLRDIQWERDEEMLAAGKTWYEIMAWPPEPSNIMPSVETSGDVALSPSSSSEHSDGSGPSTYPPTPTDFRREAMDGPHGPGGLPQPGDGPLGPGDPWELRFEWLAWDAVRSRSSEAEYEENRAGLPGAIRSRREDEEFRRRFYDDISKFSLGKFDPATYEGKKMARARRWRVGNLRYERSLLE